MVETELTPELIREGARLVEHLDRRGASPDAALWLYFPETGAWKLLLAEMKWSAKGPREAYKLVQKSLRKLRPHLHYLTLDDIAVAAPDTPIIKLLSNVMRTGPGVHGMRFSNNVVGGVPIEDSYIYRLRRPSD